VRGRRPSRASKPLRALKGRTGNSGILNFCKLLNEQSRITPYRRDKTRKVQTLHCSRRGLCRKSQRCVKSTLTNFVHDKSDLTITEVPKGTFHRNLNVTEVRGVISSPRTFCSVRSSLTCSLLKFPSAPEGREWISPTYVQFVEMCSTTHRRCGIALGSASTRE